MATTTLTSESRGKLWILMITAFIDMAGLLMVIPLLPFYATSLVAGFTSAISVKAPARPMPSVRGGCVRGAVIRCT